MSGSGELSKSNKSNKSLIRKLMTRELVEAAAASKKSTAAASTSSLTAGASSILDRWNKEREKIKKDSESTSVLTAGFAGSDAAKAKAKNDLRTGENVVSPA